jgi:hypothetical protein
MSKKKQPEFKRHFYLNWFASDWLGDPGLKLCSPDAKAVWMDMLMNMVLTFPFGHMSRLSKPKMKESNLLLVKKILGGTLLYQNPDQSADQKANQTAYQDPNQDDDQWVRLSVGLRLPEQLTLVVNIENQIPKLTGYDPNLVKEAIAELDELNVFSRTESGIIYSRRMKSDFEVRKRAFINACGGVNPYEYKPLRRNQQRGSLYQNTDQGGELMPEQEDSQSGEQTEGQGQGAHHHQPLSNSNSNSNSNTTTINKDILGSNGNGSSLGNTAGPIPELDAWLNVFNLHLVVTRKLEKDYPDYLSHFSAWWYKGDRTKKPPTLQEIKSVSKNTQQSKSLLAKYDTPA